MKYKEYLQTPHWKQVREKALLFYGKKCHLCGSKKQLNVHHNNYENLYRETLSDVVVLCKACHEKHHDKIQEPPDIDYGDYTFWPVVAMSDGTLRKGYNAEIVGRIKAVVNG